MITPMDIENKEFKKGFRGYNEEEVDEFLDIVKEDFENLYRENLDLKEKLKLYQEQVSRYKSIEETLNATLITAQTAAEDTCSAANKKAKIIVEEAELKSKQIIEDCKERIIELQNQYDINSNLQDYFARWCHEIKIPLSSLVLMNEKILDNDLKQAMKYPLEKIKQQLNYVMLGCKVQSHLYDLKVTKINILDCIKSSIRNNRFFLIEKKFDIKIDIDETFVYSDKEWLTYIIDQLINNAIKYSKKDPYLKIWTKKDKNETLLFIEDNGEGIKKEDLPRIFERGYTGSNHRNNQYKSTGFGLYMVDLILKRLGHDCYVESSFSKYTCFIIVFKDNRDFFNL